MRTIRVHYYRQNFETLKLYLVKLTDKEYKDMKEFYKLATKNLMEIIDVYGQSTLVHVKGINLNNIDEAKRAFDLFVKTFTDSEVFRMADKRIVTIETRDDYRNKKKQKDETFYALIPKAPDGKIKVMKVEPPSLVLDYSYVEGPFSSPMAVKSMLDTKKLPNFRRPKQFWTKEGY